MDLLRLVSGYVLILNQWVFGDIDSFEGVKMALKFGSEENEYVAILGDDIGNV